MDVDVLCIIILGPGLTSTLALKSLCIGDSTTSTTSSSSVRRAFQGPGKKLYRNTLCGTHKNLDTDWAIG